mgnify:CR=1 FL=1
MLTATSAASGAAWGAKLKGHDTRVLVYFGEGSSSRGQFHSALNFASIHKLPLILLCENNGWAISVPTERQMGNPRIAERAAGYGMPRDRFDARARCRRRTVLGSMAPLGLPQR